MISLHYLAGLVAFVYGNVMFPDSQFCRNDLKLLVNMIREADIFIIAKSSLELFFGQLMRFDYGGKPAEIFFSFCLFFLSLYR